MSGLGRNVSGGTRPRLSWGRSVLSVSSHASVISRTWSGIEQMGVEHLFAKAAIEALDEGALIRLARLDVPDRDAVSRAPLSPAPCRSS
jgi:hypothetical protein